MLFYSSPIVDLSISRHDSDNGHINEETFNSYCYIHDTFTLADEQMTGEDINEMCTFHIVFCVSGIYPGVGPGKGDRAEKNKVYHGYYQWVPYLLLIQAASFYVPYILYKFSQDNRIKDLIQDLQNTKPFNEIRNDKLGDIHVYLQVSHLGHTSLNLW